MSVAVTQGICVSVESMYVASRSKPASGMYFFVYHVQIENHGDEAVTLESRHWIITDGSGVTQEVRGPGVVGKTPRLEPGASFAYTSACPLSTPVGSMRGTYQMRRESGEVFDAEIAPFTLSMPYAIH